MNNVCVNRKTMNFYNKILVVLISPMPQYVPLHILTLDLSTVQKDILGRRHDMILFMAIVRTLKW